MQMIKYFQWTDVCVKTITVQMKKIPFDFSVKTALYMTQHDMTVFHF